MKKLVFNFLWQGLKKGNNIFPPSFHGYFFLWAIFFSFSSKVFPQDLLVSPIENRHQLNEEKIRHFIELQDGRIGVFTEGMLNLYDGADFKTIEIDDDNSAPLIAYRGFHHSYFEHNRIWFKYKGKISLINVSKEKSEADPIQTLRFLGFKGTPVDLFVDEKKDIWVINDLGALLCYKQDSKKVVCFLKKIFIKGSPDELVYDVVVHEQKVYLIYKSGLIRCFDYFTSKEIYKLSVVKDTLDDFTDWNHTTAVGKYLYLVRSGIGKGQFIRYDTQTRQSIVLLQANTYWLNTFAANKNGDFFISCSKGLWYFRSGSTVGSFYPELNLTEKDKIKTEVSTVLFDYQGGLWIGTLNKGIYYHHPDRSRFKYYQKSNFNLKDNDEFQVNCFEETGNGKLLIGTNQGLYITRLPLTHSKSFKVLLPQLQCHSLLKDAAGHVWISTNKGLYVFGTNGLIKQYTKQFTNSVYQTTKDEIFVCTDSGIFKWNNSLQSFGLSFLINSPVDVFQITQWNHQLIGISSNGPFMMNIAGNKIIMPLAKGQKRMPMFSQKNHKYSCLLSDSDQDLWLGTYNGLTIWDHKKQKLYELNTDRGLVNNSIKAIVEDIDRSFWVTTSRGVSHIIKKRAANQLTFRIVNYDKFTGVLEYPFTDRAALISSKNGLFIGGIDGMNNLKRNDIRDKQYVLNPILFNFKLFGKNVTSGQKVNKEIISQNAIASTDTLKLKYDQNFFSIGFSGLNYINESHTYFRYKLDHIDHNWRSENSTAGIGEASYTNITPGHYMFMVQASSDGLHWPGRKKNLLIIIEPPIWDTILARVLYLLLLCMGITFISKALIKRNALIRRKQQDYAIEMAKSDFITNMSHELRTPLTLIITPLKSLLVKVEDQKIKKELLQISSSSDLLLDTVNQLLDFKKIDTGEEILHRNFYDNLSFITELCKAYVSIAEEKEIDFIWDIDPQNDDLYLDRQKITRVIINLLSNAFKFTGSGGTVKFSAVIDNKDKVLIILVEDSGIGIPKTEIDNVFNRFYQANNQNGGSSGSGIGLYIVKYYAALHGGWAGVTSNPGQGTCFKVLFSVGKETELTSFKEGEESTRKNILIVEDHIIFRSYLADELKKHYNVITANNGEDGLKKAIFHVPDLIVTDMMMPLMDGPELSQAVRNTIAVSHIPIIMLTGRSSDESRFEGYSAGIDAYMVKPFDINLLLLRINKLLEINETRRKTFIDKKEVQIDALTDNPIDQEFLKRTFQCVVNNLSNSDYTVERFSEDMNMDRTGLYRKLMALTAHSPTNFIRIIRLKKAAELLLDKRLTIAEVSDQVGFNSISYFTKCFHDAFGKTPSQSRE
ncbi:hybrid sensor histidine kinase/response regulator transcription factor [Flavobacterium sp. ENC]|uniref:hybrid sensor histidine kinase/response regulator transcription factor n=1 Tax=Flavobacterium sp. ENC TaxID=2897330 RepID=UPI001E311EE3|nr:hybrid sensor histidine kinase/response regulator transcription factor [Flavobacterium sp. ENC]MCD0467000.1 response regulator [Flavobacterium sp. ENC]